VKAPMLTALLRLGASCHYRISIRVADVEREDLIVLRARALGEVTVHAV